MRHGDAARVKMDAPLFTGGWTVRGDSSVLARNMFDSDIHDVEMSARQLIAAWGGPIMRRPQCTGAGALPLAWALSALVLSANLTAPGRAQTAQQTPVTDANSLLPGVWRGVHSSGMTTYHDRLTVKREGKGYTAVGIAWCGMTEAQADASLRDELDLSLFPNLQRNFAHPMCVQQRLAISLQGDSVSFLGTTRGKMILVQPVKYFDPSQNTTTAPVARMLERLEAGDEVSILVRNARDRFEPAQRGQRDALLKLFEAYPPDRFSGRLAAPGLVLQDAATEQQGTTHFHFWKDAVLTAPRPPAPELGKTISLACLDGGAYHYTCYLPRRYRPEIPMPVLMNFSPSGEAQPLAPGLAEEFGWIMVGLKESRNSAWDVVSPNRDAVLLDLRRRFRIDMKRLYFSGFSGGARAAALAAFDYPDSCAGVLCVGASCIQSTPARRIPIYFLVGETDVNRAETTTVFNSEQEAGRMTALVLHPGGHTGGSPEELEAGLRWLANPKRPRLSESTRAK